jgi:SAM-dependent methyltransferase
MNKSIQEMLEANKKRWDDYAPLREKIYHKEFPEFWERLQNGENVWLYPAEIELMGDISDSECLVLGCANDAWQALSLANLGAKKVWATDISSVSIEYARKNAKDLNIDVSFVVTDSSDLSMFKNNSFDIIYAMYPYYYPNLEKYFMEWHRVLRPYGRLILNLGNNPWMKIFKKQDDGSYVIQRSYFTRFWPEDPDTLWDGMNSGKKYGYNPLAGYRWHHTVGDILNGLSSVEFVLKNFIEDEGSKEEPKDLPGLIIIRADKKNL